MLRQEPPQYPPLTAHHSPLATRHSPLTTHYLPHDRSLALEHPQIGPSNGGPDGQRSGSLETIRNQEQQTKCGWSPWDGVTLTGWPVQTWVMGKPVFRREADGTDWFASECLGQEIEYQHGDETGLAN